MLVHPEASIPPSLLHFIKAKTIVDLDTDNPQTTHQGSIWQQSWTVLSEQIHTFSQITLKESPFQQVSFLSKLASRLLKAHRQEISRVNTICKKRLRKRILRKQCEWDSAAWPVRQTVFPLILTCRWPNAIAKVLADAGYRQNPDGSLAPMDIQVAYKAVTGLTMNKLGPDRISGSGNIWGDELVYELAAAKGNPVIWETPDKNEKCTGEVLKCPYAYTVLGTDGDR